MFLSLYSLQGMVWKEKEMRLYGKGSKQMKIWYDKKGNYLEVLFERKEGYFKET